MTKNMKPLPKAILIAVPIALAAWAYSASNTASQEAKKELQNHTSENARHAEAVLAEPGQMRAKEDDRKVQEATNRADVLIPVIPETNSGLDAVMKAGGSK